MISPDQTKKVRKIMETLNAWVKDGMKDPPPKKVKIKEAENETRIIIRIPKPAPATTDTPPVA